MMTLVAVAVFGGALSVAGYALAATIGPNIGRIVEVLRGDVGRDRFEPLASLVLAERRIAVRRWAGVQHPPVRGPLRHREAA